MRGFQHWYFQGTFDHMRGQKIRLQCWYFHKNDYNWALMLRHQYTCHHMRVWTIELQYQDFK